jgi:hypothetical protein
MEIISVLELCRQSIGPERIPTAPATMGTLQKIHFQ